MLIPRDQNPGFSPALAWHLYFLDLGHFLFAEVSRTRGQEKGSRWSPDGCWKWKLRRTWPLGAAALWPHEELSDTKLQVSPVTLPVGGGKLAGLQATDEGRFGLAPEWCFVFLQY